MGSHYRVKAPQVVVKLGGGNEVYLSQGATLPASVDSVHLKHLVDRGLLESVEDVAEAGVESKTAAKK